jgi:hypothetical protein
MKNHTKIILLSVIFVMSGCGDDQADQTAKMEQAQKPKQATMQEQPAKQMQAEPVETMPATPTEAAMAPAADESYSIPPWAVLEQNVYKYPETKSTGMSPASSSSSKPGWTVLEQNVYFYP